MGQETLFVTQRTIEGRPKEGTLFPLVQTETSVFVENY